MIFVRIYAEKDARFRRVGRLEALKFIRFVNENKRKKPKKRIKVDENKKETSVTVAFKPATRSSSPQRK